MRHSLRGRPRLRGITPRRLAAAVRALRRERERLILFADQVAAEQPTPEGRVTQADLDLVDYDQGHRDLAAKHWRWGRRQLARYPEVAPEILERWNSHRWLPPYPGYFADFVRTELRKRGLSVDDEED